MVLIWNCLNNFNHSIWDVICMDGWNKTKFKEDLVTSLVSSLKLKKEKRVCMDYRYFYIVNQSQTYILLYQTFNIKILIWYSIIL